MYVYMCTYVELYAYVYIYIYIYMQARPRNTWACQVMTHAITVANGIANLKKIMVIERSLTEWRALVRTHCRRQVCPY